MHIISESFQDCNYRYSNEVIISCAVFPLSSVPYVDQTSGETRQSARRQFAAPSLVQFS